MTPLTPEKLEAIKALLAREGLDASDGMRISRRSEEGSAPLSFAQERLFFFHRLAPGSPVFHIPAAYRVDGPLDVAVLRGALRDVVQRHEALRTTFELEEGRPRQRIAPAPTDELAVELLRVADYAGEAASNCDRDALRATALLHARARACQSMPLDRAPLARFRVYEIAGDEHVLAFEIHHIVAEVQSLGILVRDLGAAYAARLAGGAPTWKTLDVQFGDFAAWQREQVAGAAGEEKLAWWLSTLGGELPTLELPLDRPRPAVQRFDGATASRDLPVGLARRVRELATRERVTPYVVTLAAWSALLARYGSSEDVIVGVPVTDRNRPEVEGVIGFFVNTLAMRTDLSGAPSFRELLRRVQETHLGAQSNQELPFERLVEALQLDRDLSRTPLFQVAFLYQTPQESGTGEAIAFAAGGSVSATPLDPLAVHTQTSKFDASLVLWDHGDGMTASCEYATALFDAETIERMLAHFERLLDAAVAEPERAVAALPILSRDEDELLLERWNATAAEIREDACVDQLFEECVDEAPERLAVACDGAELTYGELEKRANQLAHHLRKLGVVPDQPVALATGRTLEMLVGILGTLKAGGAYVPVDLAYPKERLAYSFGDAGVRVILTRSDRRAALPDMSDREGDVRVLELDTEWDTIARESDARPERVSTPRNLAYVIYTSGSTGKPKGVDLEHTGLVNLLTWHRRAYDVQPRDRATHLAGLGFDACVWELWPYITAGASMHLVPEDVRMAPKELVRWMAEQRITQSFLPTPLAEAVLREELPANFPLEVCLTGGDKLRRAPERNLPFRLYNQYGPTENTVVATACPVEEAPDDDTPPPIGTAIDNVRIYVLDRAGQAVPIGIPGELVIGGRSLARGYHGNAEMTAERFVANPLGLHDARFANERVYRTGDLVRWRPDGNIEFLGRLDDQVKVRGFRIELGEIEAQLSAHPGVAEGAVIIKRDEAGDGVLIAYAVPVDADAPLTADALRSHLRETLPEYMVPSAIVLLDALPLTANGKIDRRALPEPDLAATADEFVDPAGELEREIATVWCKLLERDSISATANFFEVGGHSLLLAQVHARLQESIAPDVTIVELFRHPTIHSLAAHLSNGTTGGASADETVAQSRDRGARRREAMKGGMRRRARRGGEAS